METSEIRTKRNANFKIKMLEVQVFEIIPRRSRIKYNNYYLLISFFQHNAEYAVDEIL